MSPALVGGSLPYVLVSSNERRIKEAVDGVKAELSLDDEQLLRYLEQNIKTDTLGVAPHLNADRVLMVLARFDKAVPYDSQLRLREAIGYPGSSYAAHRAHYSGCLSVLSAVPCAEIL